MYNMNSIFVVAVVLTLQVQVSLAFSCEVYEDRIYIEGATLGPVSEEECFQICQEDGTCKFYTWNVQSNTCGLRTYAPTNIVNAPTQRTGFNLFQIDQENIVLVGYAERSYSPEQCFDSCNNDDACFAWIWYNEKSINPNICVHVYEGRDNLRLSNFEVQGAITSLKYC